MRARLRVSLKHIGLFLVVLGLALVSSPRERAAAQEPPMRWDGLFELISGRYDYPPPWPGTLSAANAPSGASRHAMSGDGRFVVFHSDATNFGYSTPALYRRDRRTGQTEVLLGAPIRNAAISRDGNHIAMELCDPWMRPDNAPICDVWTLNYLTWSWSPLSTAPDGTFGDDASSEPVLSANGRFVVFATKAQNLSGGPAGVRQIVLRDRDADGNGLLDEPGTAVLETISAGGDADSDTAEVSDDGRFVAFRSLASNLVPGDTNGVWDVFLRDRQAGLTRRLNVSPEGVESGLSIDQAQLSMSADGRFVAFASDDFMLGPSSYDDLNGALDVFVYDGQSQGLTRIDIGWGPPIAGGYVPGDRATGWPTLSADGRYVSVQSAATNVEVPPPPDTTQVYVVDRLEQRATRISVRPDGQDPNENTARPAISGDGSVVLFWSRATNLVDIGGVADEQLFAAVHLAIAPANVVVPGGAGGVGTFTVTTQQHTLWWAEWDWSQYWFGPGYEVPQGVGSGSMSFVASEANPDPTQRSMTIRVGQSSATFTQDVGLSITSVSPTSGPMSGGTTVTVTGTGFEPGMQVYLGQMVPAEYVDSTTLTFVTPPSGQRGPIGVAVDTPDYRFAWLDNAFFYLDSTPPEVWGWADGAQGQNGWYTGDVTVRWAYWDPESDVTSTTCVDALLATDTVGTAFTCTATSEGGTGAGSITVKRDAAPPTATITSPTSTLYKLGSVVIPAFTCSDAMSGFASCTGSTNGDPIDTLTPGFHTFYVNATDQAGNPGWAAVEYAVTSNVCAYPLPGLRGWWRFEGSTLNWMITGNNATRVGLTSDVFVDGVVGQAYQFEGTNGYLATGFAPTWWSDERFAIAAWVKPSANTLGTILRSREGYAVARLANGSVAWAFRKYNVPGLSYVDTGVKLPLNAWSHVVVALEDTQVRTYLNGRLAHTATNIGDVYNLNQFYPITLGGADDRPDYFKGVLDEVKVLDHGLDFEQVEQLYLAGAAGACVHKHTSFQSDDPILANFGDTTYAIDARLVDENDAPVVGRTVKIESQVSSWPYPTFTKYVVTDADGRVHWDAPLNGAARGLYDRFLYLTFTGDVDYTRVLAVPDVLVGKGTPVITWPPPADITYGTFLSSTQLNATANKPGTFSYSPGSGTGFAVGTHTLSTTFTPSDTANYNSASATVPLTVNRATPTVTVTGGTFVYDGMAHAATGTVKNQWNISIGAPTFTYNGSAEPPVAAGTYEVIASYAGSANYGPASATTTITITKAAPSLSWAAPAPIVYGIPLATWHLNAVAAIPGTFSYAPMEGTVLNAGLGQTLNATFTPADSANYTIASVSTTIDVAKFTPEVLVFTGTRTYNGGPHGAGFRVLGVGEDLSPAVVTYNGLEDTPINAGTYEVVVRYDGSANYTPASGTATMIINKADPVVGWVAPAAITYGTSLGASQLNAAASVAGTFTYSPAAGTVLDAGSHELSANFTPADELNYNTGTAATTIAVAKATPTVSVTGVSVTYDGQPHQATASATGVGGVALEPVTLTYNGAPGAPANAGIYDVVATFAGTDNYAPASGTGTLTITKATAVLSWTAPAAIVYGTSLGAAQLNAAASVAGTFSYSPAPGSVLAAGSAQPLSATFTPADAANYSGGTVATTIGVTPAALTVRADDLVKRFGAPLPPLTATFAGFVNGETPASLAGALALATTATQGSPVGTYAIVPSGLSSANYAIAFVNGSLTVVRGAVAVSVIASPEPSGLDMAMRFTATVTAAAPAAGMPAGSVRFFDGATYIGVAAISGGTATLTTAGLDAGVHAIEGRYDGDDSFETGTASSSHVVNPATSTPVISMSSSRNPSSTGQNVTLTANITMSSGPVSGMIAFYDGATLIGSSTIASGRATFSTTALAAGSHAVTARFLGSGSAPPSVSPVLVQAVGSSGWKNRTSTTTLVSSADPSGPGDAVTLTATVSGSSSTPAGRVLFMIDGEVVGDPAGVVLTPLSGSQARASLAVTNLWHGRHKVTATYLGSSTYKGSTRALTQDVN